MRLFFGVMIPWWMVLALAFGALMIAMAPMMLLGALTESLPVWLGVPIMLLGAYIGWPLLITHFYKKKFSTQGSAGYIGFIYWFYIFFYGALTLMIWSQVFTGKGGDGPVVGTITALVGTGVTAYMAWNAYLSRKLLVQNMQAFHAAEREEEIDRHTQAILRAEEIKKMRDT
jgi:hypothetical protein